MIPDGRVSVGPNVAAGGDEMTSVPLP